MANNKFTAYYRIGELSISTPLVTELDENSVKELHLDKRMDLYNKCLTDDEFLDYYIVNLYSNKSMCSPSEAKEEFDFEYIIKNLQSIREQIRNFILEQYQYIQDCCIPIYERRERVSSVFSKMKELGVDGDRISSNGKIKSIGFDIPHDFFEDIYYIFADALCCRFQLNQFDGKYRDGMHHCLQYLDYRYRVNNYDKQYPDATEDEIKIYNRTNLLDIVTGRHNANFEVQGVQYKCSAYLDDGVFRLKIEEFVPWNFSNGSNKDLNLDPKSHSLWSVDDRFIVRLDATHMAYYIFIYENPGMNIDQMFTKKERLIDCLNKCDSGSDKFEQCVKKSEDINPSIANKAKKEFEKELKKRISDINKKVCAILGEAYSIIKNEGNGSYYVPISKNITERPDDI